MVLKFPGAWRFHAPLGETANTAKIPHEAIQDVFGWIQKVSTQGDLQEFLEHFKGHFCAANGTTHVWSSNASWAESDLRSEMEAAAENPPLFLEALYDACESV